MIGETGFEAFNSGGQRSSRFTISLSWFWCDGAGKPVAATHPWPQVVGNQAKGVRVVLTDSGLQGFRQS